MQGGSGGGDVSTSRSSSLRWLGCVKSWLMIDEEQAGKSLIRLSCGPVYRNPFRK